MTNLYALRKKWGAVYRDSFITNITSTQMSDGTNNVFKKRFRRKLGLIELLLECEKVFSGLHENKLDAYSNSHQKDPVTYIPKLPLLKTAAESYIRRMYLEFRKNLKNIFHSLVNCYILMGQS
jgi:hypothetical protein